MSEIDKPKGPNSRQIGIHKSVGDTVNIHTLAVNEIIDRKTKIIDKVEELEQTKKGFLANRQTIEAFLDAYPSLTYEDFEEIFLRGTYNKNILMCSPEIVDIIDLSEIEKGEDLIKYVTGKISISEEEFREKVVGKIDVLTVPNFTSGDVAQGYFFKKLKTLLEGTQIIFGDMPEIRNFFGKNQMNCDSVGFIDLMGNGLFKSCLLKLLKTEPDEEKLKILNELFGDIGKDIFIGGSTFQIPFRLPDSYFGISMPKTPINEKLPKLLPNGTLINSMGYLNSAYYADDVKASFVLGSHNIAEPMHAGTLTVINDEIENKHNHNWLISYFGERAGLLHYMEGTNEENQERINSFLAIGDKELERRNKKFQELYELEMKPLIYGILYRIFRKRFPDLIKN